MKKDLFYNFVGLTLLVGLLSACADKPKSGRTDTYSSGAITFASDESFSPIIDEEMQVFESIYTKAKLTPIYTNEIEVVNLLLKDSLQLAITSRRFTKKEFDNLRARTFQPKEIPLAYDGLALIINNANSDSCISVKDVKRILSGEVKTWSDVFHESKRGEMIVCFDNKQSSTVHFCVDSLLGGKPINSPNIMAAKTSKEVIDYVENTPNAIGIIGSNWLNDQRDTTNVTFKKNIRVMALSRSDKATVENSFKPYQYYLYSGDYPLVRTIYALLNDPMNGLPWGFAHFIESYKGQLIIKKSGMLPFMAGTHYIDVQVNNGE